MSKARPRVLVFGESVNDARAIRSLIVDLCPELEGRVDALPRPQSLTRSATPPKVRKWLETVAETVRARQRRGQIVTCIFVHRDSDAPDPEHQLAVQTERVMRALSLENAHAVVPVHTIEAWWLLFPGAVNGLVRAWQVQQRSGNVDSIPQPFEELRRATGGGGRRRYEKADSPRVAGAIAAMNVSAKPSGRSASYARFRAAAGSCCQQS